MNDIELNAIKIAVRFHFCNVDDNELEIYEALSDSDAEDDSEFPHVVWYPFQDLANGQLWDSVEALKDDIMRTFNWSSIPSENI
jgi:hypothetical protein